MNDLVESVLRLQLGYGEEFSLNTDIGTIYDPDLEDNLPKKLSDLGVKDESFITVVDEDDEPRVNLELVVMVPEKWDKTLDIISYDQLLTTLCLNRSEAPTEGKKPVSLEKVIDIPLKPKTPAPVSEPVNITPATEAVTGKRKAEEAGLSNGHDRAKRVANGSATDGDGANPIVLDETDGGAILIDDWTANLE